MGLSKIDKLLEAACACRLATTCLNSSAPTSEKDGICERWGELRGEGVRSLLLGCAWKEDDSVRVCEGVGSSSRGGWGHDDARCRVGGESGTVSISVGGVTTS